MKNEKLRHPARRDKLDKSRAAGRQNFTLLNLNF